MAQQISNTSRKIVNYIIRQLYRRTVLVLTILLCAGVGIAMLSMSHLSMTLIESQALQNAVASAQAIDRARLLYSSEAVARAKKIPGITVTADYADRDGAIPNPATFTISLGKQLSSNNDGYLVRLYSDYPFPSRQAEGGPRDDFEQDALAHLKQYPTTPFFRKELIQGLLTFRYAESVLMEPSCVECHNRHPNSPKKDWRVGDVRGVLEITQPIDDFVDRTRNGLNAISIMLVGFLTLALSGLALVMGKLRQTSQELQWEVESQTAELKSLASLDGLTKIANRRRFDEVLTQEWSRLKNSKLPLSLILCDIDYFKRYNDTYGHQSGDDCLRKVARVMNLSIARPGDLAARYGGEEFVILLPNTHTAGAMHVAENLQKNIQQLELYHSQSAVSKYVTLSIGVSSMVPSACKKPQDLIEAADRALYQAKDRGRNCIVLAELS
ncbi:MAG: diguanylate cyclase [Cyanobacteria bacterium SID2]|nr:diguanylate cyclase [Cyanobacteria bacterium SID2]